MSTSGTPHEGKDDIIVPAVYTGLDLRLYTNTQNSLTATTILSNITYPSGTGYATISLSGTWSSTDGVITYEHPGNPQFENTGGTTWTGGDVTGVVITDASAILHFKDLALGPVTMTAGQILEIDISSLVA